MLRCYYDDHSTTSRKLDCASLTRFPFLDFYRLSRLLLFWLVLSLSFVSGTIFGPSERRNGKGNGGRQKWQRTKQPTQRIITERVDITRLLGTYHQIQLVYRRSWDLILFPVSVCSPRDSFSKTTIHSQFAVCGAPRIWDEVFREDKFS